MWNLGELKLSAEVSKGGELKIKVDIISDELFKMFPIDDTKRLFMSDAEFDIYVSEILDRKEKWIRENIPSGVYSLIVKLDEENLIKEEEGGRFL